MFCKDNKSFSFTFKSEFRLHSTIILKYTSYKKLYISLIARLKKYESKKHTTENETKKLLKQILFIYEESETINNILLVELLSNSKTEFKKEIFEILEKVLKIFFLFDKNRHENVKIFHDFALKNEKSGFSGFSALAMPMAHLFISKFTTEDREVYTPRSLLLRNTILLDGKKKKILFFTGKIAVKYNYLFIAIYIIGTYNVFFGKNEFYEYFNGMKNSLRKYYENLMVYK